jgi:hypothetical protein
VIEFAKLPERQETFRVGVVDFSRFLAFKAMYAAIPAAAFGASDARLSKWPHARIDSIRPSRRAPGERSPSKFVPWIDGAPCCGPLH